MPKYLEETSTRPEPFILLTGDRRAPHPIFVIIQGKSLEQVSLIKAVDVTFKLFYILDIHYPWQSATTWEFFQKVVYGLDARASKQHTSPAVIAMRTALRS